MRTTNKGWLPVIGLTLSTFIFNTSDLGIPYIGYVGGAIALVAAVYFVRSLLPLLLRR